MVARKPARSKSNEAALEHTLRALADAGRLEQVDSALVHAARAIAKELDRIPSKAALWTEYRAVLEALRADVTGGSDFESLMERMRSNPRNPAQT